jgi:ketosteroid isomerase-like protein
MSWNRAAILFFAMTIMLSTSLQARRDEGPDGIKELVSQEKAFAATCAEKGIRDSFLLYFADDVVTLGKGFRFGKEYLEKRSNADPLRFRLHWIPVYGDVSQAGDLGYLTGPSLLEDAKGEESPWYGQYLSIWRRDATGWKVAVDFGVTIPSDQFKPDAPFRRAPQNARSDSSPKTPSPQTVQLAESESALIKAALISGDRGAVCSMASPSIRLYRDGDTPLDGKESICGSVAKSNEARDYKMLDQRVSTSADLGYSYGEYHSISPGQKNEGGYLHVWKRDSEGKWVIVAIAEKVFAN